MWQLCDYLASMTFWAYKPLSSTEKEEEVILTDSGEICIKLQKRQKHYFKQYVVASNIWTKPSLRLNVTIDGELPLGLCSLGLGLTLV